MALIRRDQLRATDMRGLVAVLTLACVFVTAWLHLWSGRSWDAFPEWLVLFGGMVVAHYFGSRDTQATREQAATDLVRLLHERANEP